MHSSDNVTKSSLPKLEGQEYYLNWAGMTLALMAITTLPVILEVTAMLEHRHNIIGTSCAQFAPNPLIVPITKPATVHKKIK